MKKQITHLTSGGMQLAEIGASLISSLSLSLVDHAADNMHNKIEFLLASNSYQGFPIVRSTTDLTLLGEISRSDLVLAIGTSSPLFVPSSLYTNLNQN